MELNKKALFLDLAVLAAGLIFFFILDLSLQLGKFHWLVFYLYSLYFCAAYLAANVIMYFVFRNRKRALANSYLICALTSIGVAILLWAASAIMQ